MPPCPRVPPPCSVPSLGALRRVRTSPGTSPTRVGFNPEAPMTRCTYPELTYHCPMCRWVPPVPGTQGYSMPVPPPPRRRARPRPHTVNAAPARPSCRRLAPPAQPSSYFSALGLGGGRRRQGEARVCPCPPPPPRGCEQGARTPHPPQTWGAGSAAPGFCPCSWLGSSSRDRARRRRR